MPQANDITLRSVLKGLKELDQFLLSLSPKTDTQKQVLATVELSHPYSGVFRISPAGVQQTLQALGS